MAKNEIKEAGAKKVETGKQREKERERERERERGKWLKMR